MVEMHQAVNSEKVKQIILVEQVVTQVHVVLQEQVEVAEEPQQYSLMDQRLQ